MITKILKWIFTLMRMFLSDCKSIKVTSESQGNFEYFRHDETDFFSSLSCKPTLNQMYGVITLE